MATPAQATPAQAADFNIDVKHEDQMKINLFARETTHLEDLNQQIKAKEKELQNLEDASDDVMLLDDDQCIPFQIGEIFVHMDGEGIQENLEKAKTDVQEELTSLKSNVEKIKGTLSELKVQLYAKFGDNINLDND